MSGATTDIGRERNVLVAIKRRATKYAPDLVLRKLHGSDFAVAGDPDTYGSYKGRAFAIELKRHGEGPTPLQQTRLQQWAGAGAITGVAHDADEFFGLLGIES